MLLHSYNIKRYLRLMCSIYFHACEDLIYSIDSTVTNVELINLEFHVIQKVYSKYLSYKCTSTRISLSGC